MMMMVIESETNSNVVTVFEIKTTKNPNPVIYMCIHETVITVEICYN